MTNESAQSLSSTFWDWFLANRNSISERMRSGDGDKFESTIQKVNEKMQLVAPDAFFLYKYDGQRNIFFASADGVRDAIPLLKQLIKAAPVIEDWGFLAFRPGDNDPGARIVIKDFVLSVSGISFLAFDLGDEGIGITLYPTDMTEDCLQPFEFAASVLMQHIIGEYEAMPLIDSLQGQPLSHVAKGVQAIPLAELGSFLRKANGIKGP